MSHNSKQILTSFYIQFSIINTSEVNQGICQKITVTIST